VAAAGLRLLEGRDFVGAEGEPGRRAVIIDDVLARRFFPLGGALGAPVALDGDTATVVGVLDQPRFYDVRADDRGQLFLPNTWSPRFGLMLALRVARGEPLELAATVRSVVAELDPSLAVSEVRTLEQIVDGALREERLNLGLVVAFALAALLLAALGIYGVVANTVVRRRGEIGLRMALGARSGEVARMILGQGLRLVLGGLALGLLGAWAGSRFLAALLYGVEPRDPLTFLSVATVLLGVGSLAAWLPARRATRVDPAETLRGG
jgi:putative ABC transport system permease protein